MSTSPIDNESAKLVAQASVISLILFAFLFEGLLAFIYIAYFYFDDSLSWPRRPYPAEILFGVLLAFLLSILNGILVRVSYARGFKDITIFIDEIVIPLASRLGPISALLISIAAGVGEELFFRGLLQPHIGIFATSILFSLAHFLTDVRKYWVLALIYVGIGVVFGLVYEIFASLWAPIIFHVVYDYIALLYFRYFIVEKNAIRPS